MFSKDLTCGGTTTKDLVMCAKMSEVNAIFNVILIFQVSRRTIYPCDMLTQV